MSLPAVVEEEDTFDINAHVALHQDIRTELNLIRLHSIATNLLEPKWMKLTIHKPLEGIEVRLGQRTIQYSTLYIFTLPKQQNTALCLGLKGLLQDTSFSFLYICAYLKASTSKGYSPLLPPPRRLWYLPWPRYHHHPIFHVVRKTDCATGRYNQPGSVLDSGPGHISCCFVGTSYSVRKLTVEKSFPVAWYYGSTYMYDEQDFQPLGRLLCRVPNVRVLGLYNLGLFILLLLHLQISQGHSLLHVRDKSRSRPSRQIRHCYNALPV